MIRALIVGAVWAQDKHFAKTSYSVSGRVADIQNEIMNNGPVEGAFTVKVAQALARKHGVDMPIVDAVHAIVDEGNDLPLADRKSVV